MNVRGWAIALCLVSLGVSTARAQQGQALSRVLRYEASLPDGHARELVRVPLSPAVLERVRSDLSDLRVVDGAGNVIPYVIDSGARPWPTDSPSPVAATVLEATRTLERRTGEVGYRERYLLAAPPAPPEGGTWWLQLTVRQAHWRRDLRVRARAADGSTRTLHEGTAFRFSDPPRGRDRFALGRLRRGEQVIVELAGPGGELAPFISWSARRGLPEAPRAVVPLAIQEQRSEAGTTEIVLSRPPGILPDQIVLTTSTPDFYRRIKVRDRREGWADREIGSGSVFRVEGIEGGEELWVETWPAQGESLVVEIEDRDSPPLADLSIEARVVRPSLVLRMAEGARVLFGGGRVARPDYDLSGLLDRRAGDRLMAAELPELELGTIRESTDLSDQPALALTSGPGRSVDRGLYLSRAPLTVPPGGEGLVRFVPSVALLSELRADRADLRVVDSEGRQWPYFEGERRERVRVPLELGERAEEGSGWSRVSLQMPVERASPVELELTIEGQFFDRRVEVLVEDDETGAERIGHQGRLARTPAEAAHPITVPLAGDRASAIHLRVRDGDDAPLVIRSAALVVLAPEIYVLAPPGEHTVLAGNAAAEAPIYETAEARALVFELPVTEGVLGELRGNDSFREVPWWERAGAATLLLWAVLVLAVLVLGGLTLRLARAPVSEEETASQHNENAAQDAPGPADASSIDQRADR